MNTETKEPADGLDLRKEGMKTGVVPFLKRIDDPGTGWRVMKKEVCRRHGGGNQEFKFHTPSILSNELV